MVMLVVEVVESILMLLYLLTGHKDKAEKLKKKRAKRKAKQTKKVDKEAKKLEKDFEKLQSMED